MVFLRTSCPGNFCGARPHVSRNLSIGRYIYRPTWLKWDCRVLLPMPVPELPITTATYTSFLVYVAIDLNGYTTRWACRGGQFDFFGWPSHRVPTTQRADVQTECGFVCLKREQCVAHPRTSLRSRCTHYGRFLFDAAPSNNPLLPAVPCTDPNTGVRGESLAVGEAATDACECASLDILGGVCAGPGDSYPSVCGSIAHRGSLVFFMLYLTLPLCR